jgi:glutathione S-transferase
MGQALGLLEGIVTWIRALVPPEPQRAAAAIAREAERVNRAADALEHAIAHGSYAGRLNAAQIVLGTALGLVGPRLPVWKWRERRQDLSRWYDAIAARASFRMTQPPEL